MLESKKCVSLSSYAGQCQGRLRSLDEYLAGGLGVHDAPKLSKVMLSSTSWRAEKHAFAFLLRGAPSIIPRKVPCMALGTTRPGSLPLASLKATELGVLLVIRFLKSLRLLTVNFWLTGTLLLMKYKNFLEPTFERLC